MVFSLHGDVYLGKMVSQAFSHGPGKAQTSAAAIPINPDRLQPGFPARMTPLGPRFPSFRQQNMFAPSGDILQADVTEGRREVSWRRDIQRTGSQTSKECWI
jgi:hypothetical protein